MPIFSAVREKSKVSIDKGSLRLNSITTEQNIFPDQLIMTTKPPCHGEYIEVSRRVHRTLNQFISRPVSFRA